MAIGVIQLLNGGQTPNRNNTFISGYDSGKPNYALSNFAPPDANNNPHRTPGGKPAFAFNDPDLGIVKFPTSEHYLHFQQLNKQAKLEMLQKGWADAPTMDILRGKTAPLSQWYIGSNQLHDDIKNNHGSFDDAKWTEKSKDVQMQMNATKYQQSPGFRASIDEAIKLGTALDNGGAATIIEDTASIKGGKPENKWGTGPKGEGFNMLGNSQTAFANMIKNDPTLQGRLTQSNNSPPSIDSFAQPMAKSLYNQAEAQFKSGVQILLMQARSIFPPATGQPDTSDLGPGVVRNFANASQAALGNASVTQTASDYKNSQPQPAPPQPISPAKQSAVKYILDKVGTKHGITDLQVKPDISNTAQSVVQLKFSNQQDAQNFVSVMKQQNIDLAARGNNVFLAESKQQSVFNALGVGTYGRTNPQPITNALLGQNNQAQQTLAKTDPHSGITQKFAAHKKQVTPKQQSISSRIDLPDILQGHLNNGAEGAYASKKGDDIKLTFDSKENLKKMAKALKSEGVNVKILRGNNTTDGKTSLKIYGGEQALAVALTNIVDKELVERYSSASRMRP